MARFVPRAFILALFTEPGSSIGHGNRKGDGTKASGAESSSCGRAGGDLAHFALASPDCFGTDHSVEESRRRAHRGAHTSKLWTTSGAMAACPVARLSFFEPVTGDSRTL
jgi:hypothetical protein